MATNFTTAGVLVGDDYVTLKAWISYNQTGDAIRDSYNISGVTDNATGICSIALDTDQPTLSYAVASSDHSWGLHYDDQLATGSFRHITLNNSWAQTDTTFMYCTVAGS